MKRTRAYRRYQRERHIRRKENIIKSYAADSLPYYYNAKDRFTGIQFNHSLSEGAWDGYWFVKYRGYLSKGKIHCSCGGCSQKTRNKGHRRYRYANYSPSINYKLRDLKKIYKMNDTFIDLY